MANRLVTPKEVVRFALDSARRHVREAFPDLDDEQVEARAKEWFAALAADINSGPMPMGR